MDELPWNTRVAARVLDYYHFKEERLPEMERDFHLYHRENPLGKREVRELLTSILNTPSHLAKIKECIRTETVNYARYRGGTSIHDNIDMFMKEDAIRAKLLEYNNVEHFGVKYWLYFTHPRFTYPQIEAFQAPIMAEIIKVEFDSLPEELRTKAENTAKIVLESCEFDMEHRRREMHQDLFTKMYDLEGNHLNQRMCREILRIVYLQRDELKKEIAKKIEARPIIPFDNIQKMYDAELLKHAFNKEYKVTVNEVCKRMLFANPKSATMDYLKDRVTAFFDEVIYLKEYSYIDLATYSESSGPEITELIDDSKASGSGADQPGTTRSSVFEQQATKTIVGQPLSPPEKGPGFKDMVNKILREKRAEKKRAPPTRANQPGTSKSFVFEQKRRRTIIGEPLSSPEVEVVTTPLVPQPQKTKRVSLTSASRPATPKSSGIVEQQQTETIAGEPLSPLSCPEVEVVTTPLVPQPQKTKRASLTSAKRPGTSKSSGIVEQQPTEMIIEPLSPLSCPEVEVVTTPLVPQQLKTKRVSLTSSNLPSTSRSSGIVEQQPTEILIGQPLSPLSCPEVEVVTTPFVRQQKKTKRVSLTSASRPGPSKSSGIVEQQPPEILIGEPLSPLSCPEVEVVTTPFVPQQKKTKRVSLTSANQPRTSRSSGIVEQQQTKTIIGQPLSSTDDEIIAPITPPPKKTKRVSLTSANQPRTSRFSGIVEQQPTKTIIGQPLSSTDDEIIAPVAPPPKKTTRVSLTSASQPGTSRSSGIVEQQSTKTTIGQPLSSTDDEFVVPVAPQPKKTKGMSPTSANQPGTSRSFDIVEQQSTKTIRGQPLSSTDDEIDAPDSPDPKKTKRVLSSSDDEFVAPEPPI